MAKKLANHFRLGIFVLAGLFFLVLLLYMIGKNENIFGSTFVLKARFENINGLMPGNNVRFAGINTGTVKDIAVLNDSTIEVTMLIKEKMKPFIKKNAIATIGSDGLMGNKLVNLTASKISAEEVNENDILLSGKAVDTDELIKVMGGATDDLALIVTGLKTTINKINNSAAFWDVMNDASLPVNLRSSLMNVKQSTAGMNNMVNDLQAMVRHVQSGKGSIGSLLVDTTFAHNLNEAVERVKRAGNMADSISIQVTTLVRNIDRNLNHGEGIATALLRDTAIVHRMENSLQNIQKGTEAFHQNMEALKTNFLFRGYFRRQDQQKKKQAPED
ncbi:MAG: MCE family protein [Flavisolibacter sp.]|jgi:phospholipid/cholesterol/gamma-HCH transport system substrate-binding protein|nr:MCE family protein [Flavisolibacter sp.]